MPFGSWRLSAVSTALVESSRIRIFGFFQQGPGNAEALALAAGHIGTALLDVGVIPVGELADKAIRLSKLTCMDKLPVRCLLDCPTADFL